MTLASQRPVRLFLLDPRPRHRRLRPGRADIGPDGGSAREAAGAVHPHRRGLERPSDVDRLLGRKPRERLELKVQHFDAALQELLGRVEPIHLHEQQAPLQWGSRPAAHALFHECEALPVHVEQLPRDGEVPRRGQHLPHLEPDLGPEPALPVGELGGLHLDLPLGHRHATFLPAVQIERNRHPHRDGVVGPGDVLLAREIEHRVRAEPRLLEARARRVHLGPRRRQLGVLREGPRDDCVDRLRRGRRDRAEPDDNRQREHGRPRASHGALYRTGTEKRAEPFPAGPSHDTVTCRAPLSGKLMVPT